MALSKKDKQDIAEMIALSLKGVMDSSNKKAGDTGAKIEGKPKDLVPSSKRPEILKNLTIKERKELWGEVNKDNILGNKYKCAHRLYKTKNIDGRPNVTYTEAYKQFLLPIAESNKYTKKQLATLKGLVLKALDDKVKSQKNPKAKMWVEKAIENIKG